VLEFKQLAPTPLTSVRICDDIYGQAEDTGTRIGRVLNAADCSCGTVAARSALLGSQQDLLGRGPVGRWARFIIHIIIRKHHLHLLLQEGLLDFLKNAPDPHKSEVHRRYRSHFQFEVTSIGTSQAHRLTTHCCLHSLFC
jgi:hypothetical protein